jgi:hypothetical protein
LLIGAVAGRLVGVVETGDGFRLIGYMVVGVIASLIGGWSFDLLFIAAARLIGSGRNLTSPPGPARRGSANERALHDNFAREMPN